MILAVFNRMVLNHVTLFGEGEPPGEPVQDSARREPRSPKIAKGH